MNNKIPARELHYYKVVYSLNGSRWIMKLWGVDKTSVQERIEQLEGQELEKAVFKRMDTIKFFDLPFQKLNKKWTLTTNAE